MLRLGDVFGSSYIGVYCSASEKLAIVPDTIDDRDANEIGETLGVPVLKTTIAGSIVVGSLVVANSNGVIVTNFAEKHELARFPLGTRVGIMEEKLNAAGNNILANDHGAYVNPAASKYALKLVEDVLDVEVIRRPVAGVQTVGSACIATSKGVVCHPRTTDMELKEISEFFKVPAAVATLNYGTPFLGACAVANSKGAFIGSRSTPIELGRLEDGLGLY
jgi:translation initiation factor 6